MPTSLVHSTTQFKINSVSPLIKYGYGGTGRWRWNLGSDGSRAALSDGETYYYTRAPRTNFSFRFYGTSVQVFGGSTCKSELRVDGVVVAHASGDDSAPDGGLILQAKDIAPAEHFAKVQVDCTSSSERFNFGYLAIDGWLGGSGPVRNLGWRLVDDDDPSIAYTGTWTSKKDVGANYYSDTHHIASTRDAAMTLTFTEQAVAVYGSLRSDHGLYTVDIPDGSGSTQTFNSSITSQKAVTPALLFFQGGLEPSKQHSITLTNLGHGSLDIDYVEFFSASSNRAIVDSSTESSTSPTASTPFPTLLSLTQSAAFAGQSELGTTTISGSSKVNVPAVLGGVFGGIVGLGLLAIAYVLLSSCFRPHQSENLMRNSLTTDEADLQYVTTGTRTRQSAPSLTVYPAERPSMGGRKSRSSYSPSSLAPTPTPTSMPVLGYHGNGTGRSNRMSSSSSPMEQLPSSFREKSFSFPPSSYNPPSASEDPTSSTHESPSSTDEHPASAEGTSSIPDDPASSSPATLTHDLPKSGLNSPPTADDPPISSSHAPSTQNHPPLTTVDESSPDIPTEDDPPLHSSEPAIQLQSPPSQHIMGTEPEGGGNNHENAGSAELDAARKPDIL